MKFYRMNREKELERWHVWFALLPVTVATTPDGDEERVWFERVLRCRESVQTTPWGKHEYIYKYKVIK